MDSYALNDKNKQIAFLEEDIISLSKLDKNLRFDLTLLFEYSKGVEISA
jgi:hypothetical protein